MDKPRIYIAGPMRGWVDCNYEAFAEAERYYYNQGYETVNPHYLDAKEGFNLYNASPEELDAMYPEAIKRDLAELKKCTHIALLPHWIESVGAVKEYHQAIDDGLTFLFYELQEAKMIRATGEERVFETGATRNNCDGKPALQLISPYPANREGIVMAAGAKVHSPRNWEKGIPISECVASAERHIMAFKMGKTDEDHLAQARINLGWIMHYEEMIKMGLLPASIDDMPKYEQQEPMNETPQIHYPEPQATHCEEEGDEAFRERTRIDTA